MLHLKQPDNTVFLQKQSAAHSTAHTETKTESKFLSDHLGWSSKVKDMNN